MAPPSWRTIYLYFISILYKLDSYKEIRSQKEQLIYCKPENLFNQCFSLKLDNMKMSKLEYLLYR